MESFTIVGPRDQGSEKCKQAVDASLASLQVDYLDLFLIHWPGCQKLKVSLTQKSFTIGGGCVMIQEVP